jgi:hypothetical protein
MPLKDSTNALLQKVVGYMSQSEIRSQVQTGILDPLLNHILRRVFPYIILTCVLFVLLLLAVLLTLGIIVFQLRGGQLSGASIGVGGTGS